LSRLKTRGAAARRVVVYLAANAHSLNGQAELLPDVDQSFGQRVDQRIFMSGASSRAFSGAHFLGCHRRTRDSAAKDRGGQSQTAGAI